MSGGIEDYRRAVDGFVADLRPLDGEVVGLLLHGSLAQGTVRPGQSDLLDAYLVLRQECLEDRARYLRALDALVAASARLAATGLPFHHPPCWYGEAELGSLVSEAGFLPTLAAPHLGVILLGRDFRPQMDGGAAAGPFSAAAFFEARQRLCQPLAALLRLPELSPRDRQWLVARLERIQMVLPVLAVSALGLRLEKQAVRPALAAALPGVDQSVLDDIRAVLRDDAARIESSRLRDLARRTLELAEALHDGITAARASNLPQPARRSPAPA